MQLRHIHTRLNRRYLKLEVMFWAALILSTTGWGVSDVQQWLKIALSWLWIGLSMLIWWMQHKTKKLLDEIEEAE